MSSFLPLTQHTNQRVQFRLQDTDLFLNLHEESRVFSTWCQVDSNILHIFLDVSYTFVTILK